MIKTVIKSILPGKVKTRIGNLIVNRRERRLSQLPLQEAFDEVYRKNMWKQGNSPSGVGSEGLWAERYAKLVLAYADKYNIRTVVDGGCGDFSIGSRLAPSFDRYTALDVSPRIIKRNKERYAGLYPNQQLSFAVADMTMTTFPSADLILIRQVLQHLTNAQIERILHNLEMSTWRRALIVEEVHEPRNNQMPNVDLPSHTVRTRVGLGSGVFIDKNPFNRSAKRLAVIDESSSGERPGSGLIIFELSKDTVDC
jgi:Methyltransferase domain